MDFILIVVDKFLKMIVSQPVERPWIQHEKPTSTSTR
jgi:hypothetical protein